MLLALAFGGGWRGAPMTELRGDDLARACAAAMYAQDQASRAMGIAIEEVRTDYARAVMTIREDMLNGHGICHGGFIFSLADSAFAFASNSRNQSTVAQKCVIEYKRPGRGGDRLAAVARRLSQDGRYGEYEVTVTNQDETLIARFRGYSCRIEGTLLDV